jgi:DNA-binding response OmpR family regulator
VATSISETENGVKGLTVGADDNLTKPFHNEELLARVNVGLGVIDLHHQLKRKNTLLEHLR